MIGTTQAARTTERSAMQDVHRSPRVPPSRAAAAVLWIASLSLTGSGAGIDEPKANLQRGNDMAPEKNTFLEGEVHAPQFSTNLEWLNTDKPLSLRDLRGKIVLLDFWTYCC